MYQLQTNETRTVHLISHKPNKDYQIKTLEMFIFVFLLILLILTIWLFKKKRISFIHESGIALFYGFFLGLIMRYVPVFKSHVFSSNLTDLITDEEDFHNDENTAFSNFILMYVLLPPIIFNAGFSVDRKGFFKNFGAILLYAFLGTFISCLVIGGFLYAIVFYTGLVSSYVNLADCLLFGAIISATDPVTTLSIFNTQNVESDVYSLVFGESILNDLASIILTQQIQTYAISNKFQPINLLYGLGNFLLILFGSFIIGIIAGLVNCLITKFINLTRHQLIEMTVFILISYSSILLSEALKLSGIVTILLCGLVQAHYTYKNLSTQSQYHIVQIFDLLNFISDNLIFMYIGFSVFTLGTQKWEIFFILSSFAAIFLGRVLNIYPLSFFINLTRRKGQKISMNIQTLIFFSGLRGAMSFCLAIKDTSTPARQLILATTSIIVIVTVLFNGGLTKNAIKILKVKSQEERNELLEKDQSETKNWRCLWKKFDKMFMMPLFTNYRVTLIDTLPKNFLFIARIFTTEVQLKQNDKRLKNDPKTTDPIIELNEIKEVLE